MFEPVENRDENYAGTIIVGITDGLNLIQAQFSYRIKPKPVLPEIFL